MLNGEVSVTWGIGHLVGLASMEKYGEHYKKWEMNHLPFQPSIMLYEVSERTKDQFFNAKKQLESADLIIIATDPDREGENIAYSIFSKCSAKVKNTPKKRLWINSMVSSEIQRGFKQLKDSKETFNFYVEAQTRQISDYLVGMNFTRFFTLFVQSTGLKGVYSLGRVQTPCNSLIVENDKAIKEFKEEAFYKIAGLVHKQKDIKFTSEHKYKGKDELKKALEPFEINVPVKTKILSMNKEMKFKKAPKLFNLGGIQSYANKKWKYSLDKSLKMIQTLYQKGYLSYPRTDCDLITTNEFEYLKSHLEEYKRVIGIQFENKNLQPRKEYVNNDKVLEHYAIIPTEKTPDLSSLDEAQRNIYEAVVRNTVLMFAEDYSYESTTIKVNLNGIDFVAKGNVPKVLGWTKEETLEDEKEKEKVLLPEFVEGEEVFFTPSLEEGKTKPPTRLTEASLGGKGGLMDKLGLGTPATRSSIIQTLIDREYVKVEKTKLFPTEKGILLYDLTRDILLGSPEMTAKWEEYLKKIGTGSGTQKAFLDNINQFISSTLGKLKEKNIAADTIKKIQDSDKVEVGNYLVKEESKVFKCTDQKQPGQKLIIFKSRSGKNLSISQVKQLLTKRKTNLIKGFTSKNGKKFDAYLILKGDKVEFEFPTKK
ncbi:DNA topoisomerase [Fictibacillus enclensis]|uniref:type IA DNA topoisomerase n=1 Tax=Fictibacillus enclensis TaxID=1017270 RepID=UPI0025A2FDB7|nr:type IA DNA topoisomerase [Fictibacillus enclensis]MDM5335804.1 DNA topoisomerase [Fictibacillus enclensis]